MRRCHLLKSFQEGPHQQLFFKKKIFPQNSAIKVANWIIVASYSQVSLLPASASEQGNVIGSVRVYICVQKKIVIERTRDLITSNL